jgi:hypothetical protein
MRKSVSQPMRAILLVLIAATIGHAKPAPFMMRAMVDGRVIEGQPLAWTQQQILLLGRDGALYDVNPAEAKEAKKTAAAFTPYTNTELAARLRDEFDRRFEISINGHFVVVHPRGRGDQWGERLESLFRNFTHYVAVRGFQTATPAVPLVAIVFPSQAEYYQYASRSGTPMQPGTFGHYDLSTNRIYLFDVSERDKKVDWSANAATIIHEATHQTAYNVGVHRRFAEQPRWAAEGLAMMFEARGVWDAGAAPRVADRINRERLTFFRKAASERPADWLTRLITSDKAFDADALAAYAEAWTLTFYLCETRPQDYSAYLARLAAREPFTKYPPLERMTDFTTNFGSDLTLLAAQLDRFVKQLP